MNTKQTQVIEATVQFVKDNMQGDGASHDFSHVYRVLQLVKKIAAKEKGDMFVIILGALLHDIADAKFHNGDITIGAKVARKWLESQHLEPEVVEKVSEIVANVSFKGGKNEKPMLTTEGMIVQDADRLDAIGAIGVARAFAYGGFQERVMYDPDIPPQDFASSKEYYASKGTTINHFYEKLLLLKDKMNTKTGKKLAEKRHKYLEEFLEEFLAEWEGKR